MEDQPQIIQSHALRILVCQSPYMDMFPNHHAVQITIDSGAAGNMQQQLQNWHAKSRIHLNPPTKLMDHLLLG